MKTINRRNYDDVCRELGFDPASHFVVIGPGGAIGFSVGKPDEIGTLAWKANRAGFRLTAGLRTRGRECGANV
jgi:hypothetical protein